MKEAQIQTQTNLKKIKFFDLIQHLRNVTVIVVVVKLIKVLLKNDYEVFWTLLLS